MEKAITKTDFNPKSYELLQETNIKIADQIMPPEKELQKLWGKRVKKRGFEWLNLGYRQPASYYFSKFASAMPRGHEKLIATLQGDAIAQKSAIEEIERRKKTEKKQIIIPNIIPLSWCASDLIQNYKIDPHTDGLSSFYKEAVRFFYDSAIKVGEPNLPLFISPEITPFNPMTYQLQQNLVKSIAVQEMPRGGTYRDIWIQCVKEGGFEQLRLGHFCQASNYFLKLISCVPSVYEKIMTKLRGCAIGQEEAVKKAKNLDKIIPPIVPYALCAIDIIKKYNVEDPNEIKHINYDLAQFYKNEWLSSLYEIALDAGEQGAINYVENLFTLLYKQKGEINDYKKKNFDLAHTLFTIAAQITGKEHYVDKAIVCCEKAGLKEKKNELLSSKVKRFYDQEFRDKCGEILLRGAEYLKIFSRYPLTNHDIFTAGMEAILYGDEFHKKDAETKKLFLKETRLLKIVNIISQTLKDASPKTTKISWRENFFFKCENIADISIGIARYFSSHCNALLLQARALYNKLGLQLNGDLVVNLLNLEGAGNSYAHVVELLKEIHEAEEQKIIEKGRWYYTLATINKELYPGIKEALDKAAHQPGSDDAQRIGLVLAMRDKDYEKAQEYADLMIKGTNKHLADPACQILVLQSYAQSKKRDSFAVQFCQKLFSDIIKAKKEQFSSEQQMLLNIMFADLPEIFDGEVVASDMPSFLRDAELLYKNLSRKHPHLKAIRAWIDRYYVQYAEILRSEEQQAEPMDKNIQVMPALMRNAVSTNNYKTVALYVGKQKNFSCVFSKQQENILMKASKDNEDAGYLYLRHCLVLKKYAALDDVLAVLENSTVYNHDIYYLEGKCISLLQHKDEKTGDMVEKICTAYNELFEKYAEKQDQESVKALYGNQVLKYIKQYTINKEKSEKRIGVVSAVEQIKEKMPVAKHDSVISWLQHEYKIVATEYIAKKFYGDDVCTWFDKIRNKKIKETLLDTVAQHARAGNCQALDMVIRKYDFFAQKEKMHKILHEYFFSGTDNKEENDACNHMLQNIKKFELMNDMEELEKIANKKGNERIKGLVGYLYYALASDEEFGIKEGLGTTCCEKMEKYYAKAWQYNKDATAKSAPEALLCRVIQLLTGKGVTQNIQAGCALILELPFIESLEKKNNDFSRYVRCFNTENLFSLEKVVGEGYIPVKYLILQAGYCKGEIIENTFARLLYTAHMNSDMRIHMLASALCVDKANDEAFIMHFSTLAESEVLRDKKLWSLYEQSLAKYSENFCNSKNIIENKNFLTWAGCRIVFPAYLAAKETDAHAYKKIKQAWYQLRRDRLMCNLLMGDQNYKNIMDDIKELIKETPELDLYRLRIGWQLQNNTYEPDFSEQLQDYIKQINKYIEENKKDMIVRDDIQCLVDCCCIYAEAKDKLQCPIKVKDSLWLITLLRDIAKNFPELLKRLQKDSVQKLGDVFLQLGQHANKMGVKADEDFAAAIICHHIADPERPSFALIEMGTFKLRQKRYADAAEYFKALNSMYLYLHKNKLEKEFPIVKMLYAHILHEMFSNKGIIMEKGAEELIKTVATLGNLLNLEMIFENYHKYKELYYGKNPDIYNREAGLAHLPLENISPAQAECMYQIGRSYYDVPCENSQQFGCNLICLAIERGKSASAKLFAAYNYLSGGTNSAVQGNFIVLNNMNDVIDCLISVYEEDKNLKEKASQLICQYIKRQSCLLFPFELLARGIQDILNDKAGHSKKNVRIKKYITDFLKSDIGNAIEEVLKDKGRGIVSEYLLPDQCNILIAQDKPWKMLKDYTTCCGDKKLKSRAFGLVLAHQMGLYHFFTEHPSNYPEESVEKEFANGFVMADNIKNLLNHKDPKPLDEDIKDMQKLYNEAQRGTSWKDGSLSDGGLLEKIAYYGKNAVINGCSLIFPALEKYYEETINKEVTEWKNSLLQWAELYRKEYPYMIDLEADNKNIMKLKIQEKLFICAMNDYDTEKHEKAFSLMQELGKKYKYPPACLVLLVQASGDKKYTEGVEYLEKYLEYTPQKQRKNIAAQRCVESLLAILKADPSCKNLSEKVEKYIEEVRYRFYEECDL